MRLPNLLASRNGRLTAFFFLYVTEGIPLGLCATAVATQLRRQGVGPAEIGAFVASFYLPWAFKWAFGPVIDVIASDRFGRRRAWIVGTQVMLVVTLLICASLNLPSQLALLTGILLVHNTFGAMQDVAIDALAVNTLSEGERGVANGLMFAGASLGQLIGGGIVLKVLPYIGGLNGGFILVAGCIALVTIFIALPLKEVPTPQAERRTGGLAAAGREMKNFAGDALRSFLGTRGAFAGVFFALLPAGAMGLGLALQSNIAVEVGMSDDEVANLGIWSQLVGGVFMILGGLISDKLGRRSTLAVYLLLMSPPALYLMWQLQAAGWIMPNPAEGAAGHRAVSPVLIAAVWWATMAYSVSQGLMYGTRSAIFMDVTNPRVAATQFTAYMAMMNLAISYSATWQGIAAEAIGYPNTLLIDAITGPLCVLLLPFIMPSKRPEGDGGGVFRARASAIGLALACLAYVPFRAGWYGTGPTAPMFETLFTVIFVCSAVFLAAGAVVLWEAERSMARLGVVIAPLLLAMYLRRWVPQADGLYYAVPVLGALVLLLTSRLKWNGLALPAAAPQAAKPAAA